MSVNAQQVVQVGPFHGSGPEIVAHRSCLSKRFVLRAGSHFAP
jgi:hypothetical protein